MEYSFMGRNYIGQNGEDIFCSYINSNPCIIDLKDVTMVKKYQKLDIDFVIEYFYGLKQSWEIKTDTYDSGNICFETISNDNKSSKGCFLISEADYWFYYLEKKQQAIIFNHSKAMEWFKTNQDTFREVIVKNKNYNSINCLIPIKDLIKNKWCKIIDL